MLRDLAVLLLHGHLSIVLLVVLSMPGFMSLELDPRALLAATEVGARAQGAALRVTGAALGGRRAASRAVDAPVGAIRVDVAATTSTADLGHTRKLHRTLWQG
eukprot:scaffold14245_cov52-Phaeocystis_antarctica.AAC.3